MVLKLVKIPKHAGGYFRLQIVQIEHDIPAALKIGQHVVFFITVPRAFNHTAYVLGRLVQLQPLLEWNLSALYMRTRLLPRVDFDRILLRTI